MSAKTTAWKIEGGVSQAESKIVAAVAADISPSWVNINHFKCNIHLVRTIHKHDPLASV
jgi:hypothetical protein